jgi:hypothetical protein
LSEDADGSPWSFFPYTGIQTTMASAFQPMHLSKSYFNLNIYVLVQNLLSSSMLSKKLKIKIYRNIILPVVLYGCETWSLILRLERRLRVFDNRALRRAFGRKMDEVTG